MNKNKIMIVAGGTAGHVFPAIELAKEYIIKGESIIFITDSRMYEVINKNITINSSLEVLSFPGRGFIKNNLIYNFKSIYLLSLCLIYSFLKVLFNRPKLVFGFGGYITVPPITICKLFYIPVVLHEGNKVVGKANKILLKNVNKFTFFFNDIEGIQKRNNFIQVGMPIRKEIEELYMKKYNLVEDKPINILITGGSLGAEVMALNIAKAISKFPSNLKKKIKILQQVRNENMDFVYNLYQESKIDFKLEKFIENFAEALEWSHIVICRCGSGTLSENLVSGRPSILIPLIPSADDHQIKNAKYIENIGAGWIINQKELNNHSLLVDKLQKLIFNKQNLIIASKKAKENISIGAAERLVKIGYSIIN